MRFLKLLILGLTLLLLSQGMLLAAEDNSVDNSNDSQTQYFWFPVIFESPETGIAVGGNFMAYRKTDADNPKAGMNSLNGILIYTEEEQMIVSLGVNQYFHDERFLLIANGGYVDYPSKFYGIGPDTDEDQEEDFTLTSNSYGVNFLCKVASNFYLGPRVSYRRFGIEDQADGGLLAAGEINGSDGVKVAGAGLMLLRDTRDDQFLPQNGSVLSGEFTSYRKSLGSDEDFCQLIAIYREFWPVRETKTLALMGALILSDGIVPFEMMPSLSMRGYYEGRYRDCNYAMVQSEYRFPIVNRFSGVAFASLGEIAPEIDQFDSEHIKVAGGFGMRFRIDPKQKINLRLDIGVSEDGIFSYINFMEAF